MKSIYLITSLFLLSCSINRDIISNDKTYYFYFDANNKSMKKYNSWKNGPIKYLYILENENIIFSPKEKKIINNQYRTKIVSRDTLNFNMKHISWLNSFTTIQRDSLFLKKSGRLFYIVEKDTIDNQLYLIDVNFSPEIE